MDIPARIKVGGHQIKVVLADLDEDTSGKFSIKDNTIYIDKNLPPTQMGETFLHEIFHAMNSELDADKAMHALLDSLAQQLYQVLADNKLSF